MLTARKVILFQVTVIKCWVKSCSAKMDSKPLSFQCHLSHCWGDKGIFWLLLSSPAARCAATTVLAPGSAHCSTCSSNTFAHVQQLAASAELLGLTMHTHCSLLCPFFLFFWSLCLTEDNGNFITDYSIITDFIRTKASKPSLKLRDFFTLENP